MIGAESVLIHTDGASRGNPGPASIGVVIAGQGGRVLAEFGEALGPTTNNVAEYTAVVRALQRAAELGARRVRVMMDSQLVVRQLNGSYRVKHREMIPLYRQVLELIQRFDSVTFEHVPREENTEADRLANQALDGGAVPAELAPVTDESVVARLFKMLIDERWDETKRLLAAGFRYQRISGEPQDAEGFRAHWRGGGGSWTVRSVRVAGSETLLEASSKKIAILWICRVSNQRVDRILEYRDNGA